MAESLNRPMAMLIDGDNAQPSLIKRVLAESGRTATFQMATLSIIATSRRRGSSGGELCRSQVVAVRPPPRVLTHWGQSSTK